MDLFKSVSVKQKALVKEWWDAFENHHQHIEKCFQDQQLLKDLPQWVQDHLNPVHPELFWEFGPGFNKPHRLVITPEANRELRPLVNYILKQAPNLETFEFYGYRLPDPIDQVQHTMAGRTDWSDVSDIKFTLSKGDFNRIDITYYTPFDEPRDEQLECLFVLTEVLLGEELLNNWVGALDVQTVTADVSCLEPLERLEPEFEVEVDAIKATLPDKPFYSFFDPETVAWSGFELEPEEQQDYEFKDDLFIGLSMSEDVLLATLSGGYGFVSERFSRHHETFIYLKMDRSADDMEIDLSEVDNRAIIEDRLNEALRGLGCTIGGGTGLRYSYIDLAVTDLELSIEIIQKTLQKECVTRQSWILFHDVDYHAEWIGIWSDSPTPYRSQPVLN